MVKLADIARLSPSDATSILHGALHELCGTAGGFDPAAQSLVDLFKVPVFAYRKLRPPHPRLPTQASPASVLTTFCCFCASNHATPAFSSGMTGEQAAADRSRFALANTGALHGCRREGAYRCPGAGAGRGRRRQ